MSNKIDAATSDRWRALVDSFIEKHNPDFHRHDVTHGIDAWTLAVAAGILREAYADQTIVDAHIQTVLEKIFPNAVFKDKKVY